MTVDYTKMVPPSPPGPPPSLPRQRGWWSRHWGWVVALGCLLPLLAVGGCVSGLIWFVFSSIRTSEPYEEALSRARTNPEVIERLGTPLEPKWWLMGRIDLNNDDGSADLTIPVKGPKGEGYVKVEAERTNGRWTYKRMVVETAKDPPIGLLPPQAEPSTGESPDTAPPVE